MTEALLIKPKSDIRLVKLSSGEEVIFREKSSTDTTIIMSKPITLHVVPQGTEQYGLQLFPYSPSNPEGDQALTKACIITESVDVPEGLVNAYIKRTTGIELASAVDAFAKLR